MDSKMRRHLQGSFLVRRLGKDTWRLTQEAAVSVDVFVRDAGLPAAEILRSHSVEDPDIEWCASDKVSVRMSAAGSRAAVEARSVIVHEPLSNLYEALPLASFDADARRFWRRVFRLVRIPGGRLLLGLFARRGRPRR